MSNHRQKLATAEQRYVVLTIYDIADNKRRNQMVKCLESYGKRVQKSAFESWLTKAETKDMVSKAKSIVNELEDSLIIYVLAKEHTILKFGNQEENFTDTIII